METVRVSLGCRSYEIRITTAESGLGEFVCSRLETVGRAFIVCDDHVEALAEGPLAELESKQFAVDMIVVPAGEMSKSLETAAMLYDRLAEMEADRQTLIVAVGGGVVGDLAGFAAAEHHERGHGRHQQSADECTHNSNDDVC